MRPLAGLVTPYTRKCEDRYIIMEGLACSPHPPRASPLFRPEPQRATKLSRSAEELAEEDQCDGGQGEEGDHYYGEPREVLLHDGRAGEGTSHATPQGGREPPT